MGFERGIVNAFIGLYLCVLLVDAIPALHPAHTRLKELIDPALDITGLWQGSWGLFAPTPDHMNSRISADVRLANGEVRTAVWTSPDWTTLSPGEKFTRFWEMEYFDQVREDANSAAWPALARAVVRRSGLPTEGPERVVQVSLIRRWVVIPPPGAEQPPVWEEYLFFTLPIRGAR